MFLLGDRKVDPLFICEGISFNIFTQVVLHPVDKLNRSRGAAVK